MRITIISAYDVPFVVSVHEIAEKYVGEDGDDESRAEDIGGGHDLRPRPIPPLRG